MLSKMHPQIFHPQALTLSTIFGRKVSMETSLPPSGVKLNDAIRGDLLRYVNCSLVTVVFM